MSGAPICHVNQDQPFGDPPAGNLPAIPPAGTDLASLQRTVNALRHAFMMMSGQNPNSGGKTNNNGANGGAAGGFNGFTTQQQNKKVQWSEQGRVIERVRVFQNNDETSTNWVDVERINKLAMVDKTTGQLWQWDRKRK